MPTVGPIWDEMLALPRVAAVDVRAGGVAVPDEPGVYVWFHDANPVYSGKAAGRGGLRTRLARHLDTRTDLSRSSLRRNVAEQLLHLPTTLTRARPTQVTQDQADAVNDWIGSCQLAWRVYPDRLAAETAERALHTESRPPLSKR